MEGQADYQESWRSSRIQFLDPRPASFERPANPQPSPVVRTAESQASASLAEATLGGDGCLFENGARSDPIPHGEDQFQNSEL